MFLVKPRCSTDFTNMIPFAMFLFRIRLRCSWTRILCTCVCAYLIGGRAALPADRQLYCSCSRGSMSPACPLRMLVWTSLKVKKKPSQHHPHPLSSPSRRNNGTPPCNMSFCACFPQHRPGLRSWGHCYKTNLSSDCSQEDTHTYTPHSLLTLVHLDAASPPPLHLH